MHEVETAMYAWTPAWHRLGNVLNNPATAGEAMIESGLNWNVVLHPIMVGGMEVEDAYATVRSTDRSVLGIVGKRYRVVQNADLFSFFDPVVDREERIYHTAGSLRGGKIVWLLAKLDRHFYAVDDDRVDQYVLLASSHDGSMHVTVKSTPIRVVCMNTLSAALMGNTSSMVQIRHTASAEYELRAAHKLLGLATKSLDSMKEIADSLLRRQLTNGFVKKFVEAVFPSKRDLTKRPDNRHLAPIEMLLEHDTNKLPGMEYTGWALYNSLTAHIDHTWGSDGETLLQRSWFGQGEDLRSRAIKLLLKQLED
jgi:phage/plasmid-like protein (TIGR03299 family)